MAVEIERKFLLGEYPSAQLAKGELELISVVWIDQTYLAYNQEEEIRIRAMTDAATSAATYVHTFKRGHGLRREEIEYEISERTYEQLLKQAAAQALRKKRTRILDAGHAIEIDEYEQFALKTVEVEFTSIEAAHRYDAPVWFGREIGSEEEYQNKALWAKLNVSNSK